MTPPNKLQSILDKIVDLPAEYVERSLYKDRNELMMLCDNIIANDVNNIIEIGTYGGVASAVFSSIIKGNVYTININDSEISRAKSLWDTLNINNIIQIKGSSLTELPQLVNEIPDVGFIYVDGNHDIPYAMQEFEIIKNSQVKDGDCLVYFDDGPLAGVMQAIHTHNLTTVTGRDWMLKDEEKKEGGGTLRAYHKFGNFRLTI